MLHSLRAIPHVVQIQIMLVDDATSILHKVVVIPGADISPSIVVGIWQTAVDIIREIALVRPSRPPVSALWMKTDACHMSPLPENGANHYYWCHLCIRESSSHRSRHGGLSGTQSSPQFTTQSAIASANILTFCGLIQGQTHADFVEVLLPTHRKGRKPFAGRI